MGSGTSFSLPWPGLCKNIEFVFTASNVYLFRLFVCLFVCFILFVSLFVCFFSGERPQHHSRKYKNANRKNRKVSVPRGALLSKGMFILK